MPKKPEAVDPPVTMTLHLDLPVEHICMALSQELPHDVLVDFIKELDNLAQDWDVTETLYKHFKKLHQEFKKEKK